MRLGLRRRPGKSIGPRLGPWPGADAPALTLSPRHANRIGTPPGRPELLSVGVPESVVLTEPFPRLPDPPFPLPRPPPVQKFSLPPAPAHAPHHPHPTRHLAVIMVRPGPDFLRQLEGRLCPNLGAAIGPDELEPAKSGPRHGQPGAAERHASGPRRT